MRGIAFLIAAVSLVNTADATDFYVTSSGNDTNPGTGERPWATIRVVNDHRFGPGDRLFFEGGATFKGELRLGRDDSGAEGQPVIVTSYGHGRATLTGGTGRAISCDGCRFIAFRNLDLAGDGRKSGNTDSGLFIGGGAADIEVDGIQVSGFRNSGVEVQGSNRVRLLRVHAHENGAAGISSGAPLSHDLYIGYSLAENNPGDPTVRNNHSGNGIVIGYVSRGVIEHSEARYNGWDMPWTGNGPVGIWAYESDRVTIQFCLSHDNRSTAEDGGGFDFDGGMTNSVLQYNYSYGNFGTGYLICQYDGAGEFANNTVRYNISQDDGLMAHNAGIYVWVGGAGMKSTIVYNNTIFNTKGSAVAFGAPPKYAAERPRFEFYNNIFVSRMPQIVGGANRGRFAGNLYWSMGERGFEVDGYRDFKAWARATGQEMEKGEMAGMYQDPRLRKDGAGLIRSPQDLEGLHEYELLPDSPVLGAGINLRVRFGLDPGVRDYFGTALTAGTQSSIGACQGPSSGERRRADRR